jgi:threonyl-tRNA synthetase
MIIVGEKEENNQTLSVRKHAQGDLGTFSIQEFVLMVQKEIDKAMSH